MANDLNQCNFIGRLGKEVETRYLPSGDAVANFSIAVGKKWTDKASGEKKESATWVNIVAFGKLAEICAQYLVKGSQVHITGELRIRMYEKDGVKHYPAEIVAASLQMIGGKPAEGEQPAAGGYQRRERANANGNERDSNPAGRPGGAPDHGFEDDGIPFS